MAESTFRIPSTITIDSIVLDASSPLDGEVFVFDGTSFTTDSIVPIGTIEMWAGLSSSIPSGWLLCDGGQYPISTSGSQYYALSQIITTRYGSYTNGSGSAGSSHFVVPNMTAYIPYGITSGANAGATTTSYAATSLAHSTHTPDANATTNADGASHTHTMSDGGSHNHSLVTSNWNHYHDTGGPSNTHRHNIGTANQPSTNATGFTAHDATQHGFFSVDNAQVHSHTTGTQTSNANHGHTIPTSTTLSHSHTWSNSATSDSANTTAHNHTLNVVPICFIIKF
jgi:microcystin-dependent protein